MFKLLLMGQTLFDFDVLLPCSCVALSCFLSFEEEKKKKKKKKPRKMFGLRLSQQAQVELICPQAKINFPLLPPAACPPLAELCCRTFA